MSAQIPMLEEVTIDNFKGIESCEITNLGRVNLFVGRNGCGKSAIMESIYFTGKEFLAPSLAQCIQRRANRDVVSARELWFAYDMSSHIRTTLRFDESNLLRMRIALEPQSSRFRVYLDSGSENQLVEEYGGYYEISEFRYQGGISYPVPLHTSKPVEVRHALGQSVFIDPSVKRDIQQIERNYLNIVKLSEESSLDLSKRTADVYETQPSWEFLPHPDMHSNSPSRFAILEGRRRLFFDDFGDGLHYGLAILSIAKTRNNTALFIEEIESHQHPVAIKKLVAHLLDIARTNNLQLFITTHSDTALRYLYYYYETQEKREQEFRCFHITRDRESGRMEARIEEGLYNIQEDLHGNTQ